VTLKQAICALSRWNSVTVLWVPGHSGIQGNEVAQIRRLGRDRVAGKLEVKEWLREKHS
jgi:ribonuclease HI